MCGKPAGAIGEPRREDKRPAHPAGAPASLDRNGAWVCHPPLAQRARACCGLYGQDHRRVPQISLHTPVGDISVSEDAGRIVALDWGWGSAQSRTPLLLRARDLLQAYFDGEPVSFDLPLAPEGTPYRQRVWAALCRIPAGETRTYAEIAREAGGGPRSVGGANGANPIPILIPCHRVVATGGIGGYSGGDGLSTKLILLDLEARAAGTPLFPAGWRTAAGVTS